MMQVFADTTTSDTSLLRGAARASWQRLPRHGVMYLKRSWANNRGRSLLYHNEQPCGFFPITADVISSCTYSWVSSLNGNCNQGTYTIVSSAASKRISGYRSSWWSRLEKVLAGWHRSVAEFLTNLKKDVFRTSRKGKRILQ